MTQKITKIVFDGTPLCATNAEYQLWLDAARIAPPGNAGFCEDCTPEFQSHMKDKYRCSHPEITFDANGDGRIPPIEPINELVT